MSGILYHEMVPIPSASYIYRVVHRVMEGDCEYDHGPRLVSMPAFAIGKYPVTNAMFQTFLHQTGYQPSDSHNFLKHWQNGACPAGMENHPVVWVSQNDAKAYAKWAGGRLPKDYEWQYAAAGPDARKYPWGDLPRKDCCNGQGKSLTPVDRYPQGESVFGVADLIGNAREWVDDVVDDGMHRFTFLRGGCFYQAPHFWHTDGGARPTDHHLKFQLLSEGQNRCSTTSFRIVKEVEPC